MTNPPLEKLIIIPSKSRYDLSVERWKTMEHTKIRFRSERKWKEVTESNERQKYNWNKVEKIVGKNLMIDRSNLTPELINDYDAFVFLGGDDHFTYCSQVILQYMKENPGTKKCVVGVLLDDLKSWGGILYFNVDKFLASIPDLSKGNYNIENWTTLEARVHNGEKELIPYPAVAHFFSGEYCNLLMSRNDVFEQKACIDGKQVLPEKGSGLLVVVGAGSGPGSWYHNVHMGYFDESDTFPKDADFARLIVRENYQKPKATLHKGQVLVLDSYNDARGIISSDSHEDHSVEFEIGSQAKIWISDLKLPVVRIK